MEAGLTEILAGLNLSRGLIDAALRQAADPPRRATLLAEALRALWPASPLHACLLWHQGQPYGCLLDDAGQPVAEWRELLSGAGPAPGLKLPGYAVIGEDVVSGEDRLGQLVLAAPDAAPPETIAAARILLAACSENLAHHLHLEAHERQHQSLHAELAELVELANLSELARPLVHEFGNYLNVVHLHIAVVEQEAPGTLRADLAEIVQHGKSVLGLIRQWQQYRRHRQVEPQAVDLNAAVQHTVESLRRSRSGQGTATGTSVVLSLADDRLMVRAGTLDLRRLCTFLITNALAAVSHGGEVFVRTEAARERVLLRVEDTGPNVPPELLPQLFEPQAVGRLGTSSLELAACASLVRRYQGKIRADNRTNSGLTITVELQRYV